MQLTLSAAWIVLTAATPVSSVVVHAFRPGGISVSRIRRSAGRHRGICPAKQHSSLDSDRARSWLHATMPQSATAMFNYDAWLQWFQSIDRTILFVGVLPFVVIVVGLWSKYAKSRKDRRERTE